MGTLDNAINSASDLAIFELTINVLEEVCVLKKEVVYELIAKQAIAIERFQEKIGRHMG